MYFKDIETSRKAAAERNQALRAMAADRLKALRDRKSKQKAK